MRSTREGSSLSPARRSGVPNAYAHCHLPGLAMANRVLLWTADSNWLLGERKSNGPPSGLLRNAQLLGLPTLPRPALSCQPGCPWPAPVESRSCLFFMCDSSATRAAFITKVLTSHFPGEVAKRFAFPDWEVGVLYTMGQDPVSGRVCPVVLYLATFPPSPQ